MENITYATRVCKVLGVETMIGLFTLSIIVSKHVHSLTEEFYSYKRCWWFESRLPSR
jgi:hypothetical protein